MFDIHVHGHGKGTGPTARLAAGFMAALNELEKAWPRMSGHQHGQ